MATEAKGAPKADARSDSAQTTIRVPKAIAAKLGRVADARGVSIPVLVESEFADAIHAMYAKVIRTEHAKLKASP